MNQRATHGCTESNLEQTHQLIIDKFPPQPILFVPIQVRFSTGSTGVFQQVPLTYPSLDIGVNDGSTAV